MFFSMRQSVDSVMDTSHFGLCDYAFAVGPSNFSIIIMQGLQVPLASRQDLWIGIGHQVCHSFLAWETCIHFIPTNLQGMHIKDVKCHLKKAGNQVCLC